MAADTVTIEQFLVGMFTADPTLIGLVAGRAYTNLAPPFPTMPCILIRYTPGGRDQRALDANVSIANPLFEIVAVGTGNDTVAVQAIADRLDFLLSALSVDASTYRLNIGRQSLIDRPDVLSGTTRYTHLGALYEIRYRAKR